MPAFSPTRDAIFSTDPKVALQIGGFPDFYALLGTARDASRAELEDAITSRAADLLAASFSRGKSEFLRLVETHVADFRPVLLDKTARLAYNQQLQLHEIGDPGALDFAGWKTGFAAQSRLSRGLEMASLGLKARLRAAFWDSEYF